MAWMMKRPLLRYGSSRNTIAAGHQNLEEFVVVVAFLSIFSPVAVKEVCSGLIFGIEGDDDGRVSCSGGGLVFGLAGNGGSRIRCSDGGLVFGLEGDDGGRISYGGGGLFFGLESDNSGRVSCSGGGLVFGFERRQ
jgi:hypothetical protein